MKIFNSKKKILNYFTFISTRLNKICPLSKFELNVHSQSVPGLILLGKLGVVI